MNPDFKLCDICGARAPITGQLHVEVGLKPDGNGGKWSESIPVDLCEFHKTRALEHLLTEPNKVGLADHEAGRRLCTWARDQGRKWRQNTNHIKT
jgi:hypothetical protein